MTKQEEIREGIARELYYQETDGGYILWCDLPEDAKGEYRNRAIKLMVKLHSQGVVIRVDSDTETIARLLDSDRPFAVRFIKELKDKAGYVVVKPLIGGE